MTTVRKVYRSVEDTKEREIRSRIVDKILDDADTKLKFYTKQANIFIDDFGQLSLTRQNVADLAVHYDVLNVLANENAIPKNLRKEARKLQKNYGKLIGALESGHYMNSIQSRSVQVIE